MKNTDFFTALDEIFGILLKKVNILYLVSWSTDHFDAYQSNETYQMYDIALCYVIVIRRVVRLYMEIIHKL